MNPNPSDPLIPFSRVSKFVRLMTHDVRNGLSAIDLQSAYVAELVTDPEVVEEVRKLRSMVTTSAKMLRELSLNFQPVTLHLMEWEACTVAEELEVRARKVFPDEVSLQVERRIAAENVLIDLEQFSIALLHVLQNALQFRDGEAPVRLSAFLEDDQLVFEVIEQKGALDNPTPPEEWGTHPLLSTRQGGYGLGLYRARQILDGHKGTLKSRWENGELVTRLSIPLLR